MQTVTLNDGTVLNASVLESGYGDWITVYVDGMTLADGFLIFSDTEKTRHMVYENYGRTLVYDGFTALSAINDEFGNCNVMLRKVI